MQEPLLIPPSEPETKQKVEKLKYFYKASTLSKLFFSWISILIEVHVRLIFSTVIRMISSKTTWRILNLKTGPSLSMRTGMLSGVLRNIRKGQPSH